MLSTRQTTTQLAQTHWDLVVIGGGITGTGVLLEACRLAEQGKKILLLEQKDFAWGTSSRSSKMVHGGLRYMAQADFRLVKESLQERERMLKEIPNLVYRQPYLFLLRKGDFPNRWAMDLVLWLYDKFAGIKDHHWVKRAQLLHDAPQGLNDTDLLGAMYYTDALVDDARLVMRVLHEAAAWGAHAQNYTQVQTITPCIDEAGCGFSLNLLDTLSGEQTSIHTTNVVNATGAFADNLSGTSAKVRPQRGSHLFIPHERLPVLESFTVPHPDDKRPVFVYPWMGMTCVGTTDLDHKDDIAQEARCSAQEVDYLLKLLNHIYPERAFTRSDIVSSIAGVRPIIASGKGVNPSQESRDHSVWDHEGIITVSGGKLTTFRLIAHDVLHRLGWLDEARKKSLRHTKDKLFQHDIQFPHDLGNPRKPIPSGEALCEVVRWVLAHEQVVHLDDLLLRRIRIGNTQARGGQALLPLIRPICQALLHWDDARWESEQSRYLEIINTYYGIPV